MKPTLEDQPLPSTVPSGDERTTLLAHAVALNEVQAIDPAFFREIARVCSCLDQQDAAVGKLRGLVVEQLGGLVPDLQVAWEQRAKVVLNSRRYAVPVGYP